MGFLLLAIACSAAIALVFKHSEGSDRNRYAVTSVNYAVAAGTSLVLTWLGDVWPREPWILDAALAEVGGALRDPGVRLGPVGGSLWALMTGLCAGVFFFLGFIYYQIAIRKHGAALAGAFIKMGILVPMALSLILWREFPTFIQYIGMALALAAVAMVNWPGKVGWARALQPALLLLFLFGGIAEFSNKIYQQYGPESQKTIFLAVTFSVALVLSLVLTIRYRKPVQTADVLYGIGVGLPNLFAAYFLIMALETIPAAVAFPAFGAGTILVIALAGVLVYREPLSKVEKVAILMIAASLVLINLSP